MHELNKVLESPADGDGRRAAKDILTEIIWKWHFLIPEKLISGSHKRGHEKLEHHHHKQSFFCAHHTRS